MFISVKEPKLQWKLIDDPKIGFCMCVHQRNPSNRKTDLRHRNIYMHEKCKMFVSAGGKYWVTLYLKGCTLSDYHLSHNRLLDRVRSPTTAKKQELELYRRSCGDLPALNGPLKASNSPKASWLFGSGGQLHYYDKTLYHALCCDDDYNDEDRGGMRSSRLSSTDSVFSSSPPRFLTPRCNRKTYSSPDSKKRALRSCSTQTVSDKSTQTHFPYIPAKQRASSDYKN
uniref:Inhibitory synaptic factor 1 n=1 Tax=Sinocyclocheilus grahami TaxID=75366 RepID=A0A672RX76_SINGR